MATHVPESFTTCLACGKDLSNPLPGCVDCRGLHAPPPAVVPRPPPSDTRVVVVPKERRLSG